MSGGGDVEPLVSASGWVGDEVSKGCVEGLNRALDVLEEKE